MSDWRKTDYGTPDTWAEQQTKKRAREFDEKYPTTWKDRAYVAWIVGALVVAGLATLGFFLAWIAKLLG